MNQRKEIIWRMFLSKTGVEIGGLLRSAQPQVLHCASTPDSIPRYLGSFGYSNREQEIGVCELASLSFPCPLSYVPMDREPCNLVIIIFDTHTTGDYTLMVWRPIENAVEVAGFATFRCIDAGHRFSQRRDALPTSPAR